MLRNFKHNNSKDEPHLAISQNGLLQTSLFAHNIYLYSPFPGSSVSAAQDFLRKAL